MSQTFRIGWGDLTYEKQEELTDLIKSEFKDDEVWVKENKEEAADTVDRDIADGCTPVAERQKWIDYEFEKLLDEAVEDKINREFYGSVEI